MILRRVSRRRPSVAIRALSASRRALAWARRFFASSTDSGVGAVIPSPRQSTITNRSEEHTSELQSLMRISYAVFCLKKKKIRSNDACTTASQTTKLNNRREDDTTAITKPHHIDLSQNNYTKHKT